MRPHIARRSLLLGAGAAALGLSTARRADATLLRGLTLRSLVSQSEHILIVQPLESHSRHLEVGGRRSIVTETLVRVQDVVAWRTPETSELVIRALGGRIGNIGEIVHGQPELQLGTSSLTFLTRGKDGTHWVLGMAQGHYPIVQRSRQDSRLAASRNLPTIRDWESSGARQLIGKNLRTARDLIVATSAP